MRNFTLITGFLLLLQFCLIPATTAIADIEKNSEATAFDIAGTIKALRREILPSDDTSVPIKIRPLLTKLKHQLRDLISTSLNVYPADYENLENVGKVILEELQRQGISIGKRTVSVVKLGSVDVPDNIDDGYMYGDINQVVVRRVINHPDLIAATTTIDVVCGDDTSLYIFKRINEKWKLVIAQEASDYELVSDAQGRFSYSISPPSDNSEFFVVTKSTTPWCTSAWKSIRYQVLRQGVTPYQPIKILNQKDGIYVGNENYGYISILPTGFTIEFEGDNWLGSTNPGHLTRNHVKSYQLVGDKIQKIQPFAREPENFLDEWFNLSWDEASKWVQGSALNSLRSLHTIIRNDRSGEDKHIFENSVFSPPACEVKPDQWQVGIKFSPYDKSELLTAGVPKELYFTIIRKDDDFFVKEVSKTRQQLCRDNKKLKGSNLHY